MERSIFFFLKSHISAPGAQNSPIFFPSVNYTLYLHVIIDFGHIWGPFMAEIEKMLFWLSQILGTPKVGVRPEKFNIGNVAQIFLAASTYVGTMRFHFRNISP